MSIKTLVYLGCIVTLSFGLLDIQCGRKANGDCQEFFSLSAQQQEIEFRKFSLEKKIVLYKCGMKLHPKTIGLAYLVATDASGNIPILLDSVNQEADDSVKADLIYIFEVLAERGDLKGRQDVELQLQDVISTMREPAKQRAVQSLAKISKSITQ